MKLTVDAGRGVFERRDAKGSLKALVLEKSVLIGYAEDRIYVAANCDRSVNIPVEPADRYARADKVFRDGMREPVSFFKEAQSLVLDVSDAGSGVLCYEILSRGYALT